MAIETRSKSGAGEFFLTVDENGAVTASIHNDGSSPRYFATAQDAYDEFRPRIANPSCWNLCYHLEDFICAQG